MRHSILCLSRWISIFSLLIILLNSNQQIRAQVYGTPVVVWDFANGIPDDWENGIISTNSLAHWEYRGPNTAPNINTGARGSCAAIAEPIASNSQDNGFVIFDGNFWDDPGNSCGAGLGTGPDPAPHTAWLTTNSVDLSSMNGAVITFQQQYRHFQTTTKVQISTDDGATWTDIITNSGLQSTTAEWKSANISSFVTGQTNVRFKFIYSGVYYWWLLDDITVYQPNQNDLLLSDIKFTNNAGPDAATALLNMEYDQYPIGQIPAFNFKGTATNIGAINQTGVQLKAEVIRNGSVVYQNNTSNSTLNSANTANLTIAGSYTNAAVTGDYKIRYTLFPIANDESPANNKDSLDYSITNYTFAKDEGPMEDVYTPSAFYANYQAGFGNYFESFGSGKYIHSVSVGIAEGSDPGAVIEARIYNSRIDSVLAVSNPYTINAGDLNLPGEERMAYIDFAAPFEFKNDSLYFVMVVELDSTSQFTVARSGKSFAESSIARFPNINASFVSAKSFMIRLNLFAQNAIPGCTDLNAYNYQSNATIDDGSCLTAGCTYVDADNYASNATFDDGSCILGGCIDITAANYNPVATYDIGNCIYPGCTDNTALNYSPIANEENGSCYYLYALIQANQLSGCAPLTVSFDNNNNFGSVGVCSYTVNNNTINEECVTDFSYTFETPGVYTFHYHIQYNNANADTTFTIEVFPNPAATGLTYGGLGSEVVCDNCDLANQHDWYLNGELYAGSGDTTLNIFDNGIPQNGIYRLLETTSNGCQTWSDSLIIIQPFAHWSNDEGCVPYGSNFYALTDMLEGMTCSLQTPVGTIIENPTSLSFDFTTAGTQSFDLACTWNDVTESTSFDVNAYSVVAPVLENDTIAGEVVCTNASAFVSVNWLVDGAAYTGASVQDGGNYYAATGTSEQGCTASSVLIIASTEEILSNENARCYPNPAQDILYVNASPTTTYEIYSSSGQLIASGMLGQGISVRELANGCYELFLNEGGMKLPQRFMVQH